MALLDFIKNRPQQQPVAKPAPEPVKPAATKDLKQTLSPDQLAQFREVGKRMQQATTHIQGAQPVAGDGSNNALLQKHVNQEKTQAALSPTDQFKGQTATQKRARGWER